MPPRPAVALLALCLALPALAAEPTATAVDTDTPTLQAVVVSGVLPGPGLWKVSRDDGHVLWVLGSLSPVPRRMQWESLQVERTLARAGQVLLMPGLKVDADVGLLGGLTLLPSALAARKLPDGQSLKDVLPAPLYARWQALKTRYIGNDRGIERWRPIFAARELYEAGIRDAGLRADSPVEPWLRKRARRLDIPTEKPQFEVVITQPRAALKDFASSPLDDLACFEKTLDRLESDLANMRDRANAWAIGDIAALQALPYEDQGRACLQALLDTQLAQQIGMVDAPQRIRTAWLQAAEAALAAHPVSLAVLPMPQLLSSNGYLAELAARGYRVEAPQAE